MAVKKLGIGTIGDLEAGVGIAFQRHFDPCNRGYRRIESLAR